MSEIAAPDAEPPKEPTPLAEGESVTPEGIVVEVGGHYPKGKHHFNRRLADEGRMNEFKDFRDLLKETQNMPESEGWRVAGSKFPPMNGEPMEYNPTLDTLRWIEKLGLSNPWGKITVKEVEKAVEKSKKEGTASPLRSVVKEVDLETVTKKKFDAADTFAKLATLAGKKTAPELESIRWAFNNTKTPLDQIDTDEVPCAGAVSLLEHIRSSSTAYGEFLRTLWIKLIPDKKQLEYESRFSDDGGKQLDLLSQFDDEFRQGDTVELEEATA